MIFDAENIFLLDKIDLTDFEQSEDSEAEEEDHPTRPPTEKGKNKEVQLGSRNVKHLGPYFHIQNGIWV